MSTQLKNETGPTEQVLLGDEAVALGAIDAGITAAYAYPGTPSTEILQCIQTRAKSHEGTPIAYWCANEKTAYEQALGMSMAGKRSLVAMKHVGLNVAADPFMNSALVNIDGGLVVAVADDPGMHSSQNEQDSRYFADFAHIPCFEPADQQQAYDMTREAFEISERYRLPVLLRLVTRLAHSRAAIRVREPRPEKDLNVSPDKNDWVLLPAFARRLWLGLVTQQAELRAHSEDNRFNTLSLKDAKLGVITTGIARNYYLENVGDLGFTPSHLHVGVYPLPVERIRALVDRSDTVVVLEEGYPYLERFLTGIVPPPVEVRGKQSGHVPATGELDPDNVRRALGLDARGEIGDSGLELPVRPPQLCKGCPHGDAYRAIKQVLSGYDNALITNDIGCYTLGVLPPYNAGESCVCMGASVGMAKGAAEAGMYPVVAVIGDSTFLHSGVTPLMDAVAHDTNMTLVILDNETVAMTGTQPTVLPSPGLDNVALGLGVDPEHCHVVDTHPKRSDELVALLTREIAHPGLSVIVAGRECLEKAKQRKAGRWSR